MAAIAASAETLTLEQEILSTKLLERDAAGFIRPDGVLPGGGCVPARVYTGALWCGLRMNQYFRIMPNVHSKLPRGLLMLSITVEEAGKESITLPSFVPARGIHYLLFERPYSNTSVDDIIMRNYLQGGVGLAFNWLLSKLMPAAQAAYTQVGLGDNPEEAYLLFCLPRRLRSRLKAPN